MSNKVTNRLEEFNTIQLVESNWRIPLYISAEAIKDNVESNELQISEIHQAISEAEAGGFATQAEVDAVVDKWQM